MHIYFLLHFGTKHHTRERSKPYRRQKNRFSPHFHTYEHFYASKYGKIQNDPDNNVMENFQFAKAESKS